MTFPFRINERSWTTAFIIHKNEIGKFRFLVIGPLGGHTVEYLLPADAIAFHHPFEPQFFRCGDENHCVELPVSARLEKDSRFIEYQFGMAIAGKFIELFTDTGMNFWPL